MALPDQIFHLRPLEEALGYSQAVRAGDTLYITGSVSADDRGRPLAVGDMEGQLRNAYEDVRKTLAAFNLDFRHVVKETIHTLDFDALLRCSERVRRDVYEGAAWPATMWHQVVRLIHADFLVEVEVIAQFPPETPAL